MVIFLFLFLFFAFLKIDLDRETLITTFVSAQSRRNKVKRLRNQRELVLVRNLGRNLGFTEDTKLNPSQVALL